MNMKPFHLAIPVHDLEESIEFYKSIFPISFGRSAENWIDLNFYGHQLVLHMQKDYQANEGFNYVDGDNVPFPHFGIVLSVDEFYSVTKNVEASKLDYYIKPRTRFKNTDGEQSTFFLKDPSGNFIEVKAFKNIDNLFKC